MATIFYGAGDRTIFGTNSDDTIAGQTATTLGNDTLFGRAGDDILLASAGNDKLFGGTGNDVLKGEGGNDTIAVETNLNNFGADRISGGAGFDRVTFQTAVLTDRFLNDPSVSIEESRTGVRVDLENPLSPGNVSTFIATSTQDGDITNSVFARGLGSIRDLNGTSAVLEDVEEFQLTAFGDMFLDSSASHIIRAGGGNDFISGGGGFDVIDGGAGIDTAMYRFSDDGVSVFLQDFGSGGSGSGGEAEGDRLYSIENVFGSNFNDVIVGDENNNEMRGFDGNDFLSAAAGSDRVFGGNGNDTLRGGTGNDYIEGGEGTDTVQFSDWNGNNPGFLESIRGQIILADGDDPGSASLVSSTFNFSTRERTFKVLELDTLRTIENVEGSKHADTITGNSAANVLNGLDGNDTIDGGKGNDTLFGGNGVDTATFNATTATEAVAVSASLTTNSAVVTRTDFINGIKTETTETDTLSGIENLTGTASNDTLTGDSNANVLRGQGGNDILSGRGGADVLNGGDGIDTVSYLGSSSVNVNLATNSGVGGDADGDTFVSIENITGSTASDTLVGNAARNTISGSFGNDTIEGGGGADRLDGGNGINTLSYEGSAGVQMSLDGRLIGTGDAAGDEIFNFRHITGSATGNDVLRGDNLANVLTGNGGDDRLQGGGGGDKLNGGDGFDQADYSLDGAITIDLAKGIFSGAASGDQFNSIEGVIGGFGSNVIKGDGEANTFSVTGGDSRLIGRGGNDTLLGAGGKDLLEGGSGDDTMNGGANTDRLFGNNGNDTMNGSFGNDILNGGNGDDVMTGGLGNDVFVFNGGNAGQDTITDFEDGLDAIRFKTALVDSFEDLAIAGNGTGHVTVIYGDQSINIFGDNPITLTADDFAIV